MSPEECVAHYRLTAKLGRTRNGRSVARHRYQPGREVAIKTVTEAFAGEPDRMTRFVREAQVPAALNHPNIAVVYGVEERAIVVSTKDKKGCTNNEEPDFRCHCSPRHRGARRAKSNGEGVGLSK